MTEVLGIGALLADQIIEADDAFLLTVGGEKGGMEYAAPDKIKQWLQLSKQDPVIVPGGSAANVIRTLANMGNACAFLTKIGKGPLGQNLQDNLKSNNITLLASQSEHCTGRVLSIVTPDGERTMRTYLGANAEWSPDDLDVVSFANKRLVHIEGYLLVHPLLAEQAMRLAKEAKSLISFDLSSFEVVNAHKERIVSLISTYADFVFANADEAKALTGYEPEAACRLLKDICPTVVITMSTEGCWVGSEGILQHYPAYAVTPVDTTGAGDLFTGGFLHGLLAGMTMEECARVGALAGRAVVQVKGPILSTDQWEQLRNSIVDGKND